MGISWGSSRHAKEPERVQVAPRRQRSLHKPKSLAGTWRWALTTAKIDLPTEGVDEALVVVLRIRPLNQREKDSGDKKSMFQVLNHQEIQFHPLTLNEEESVTHHVHGFTFDHVLPESSTQESLFQLYGNLMTKKSFDGVNCTLFAYGQTSSGKTYTISGTAEEPGFMPRFVDSMFKEFDAKNASPSLTLSLEVSYVEIYNENIFDLLQDSKTGGSHKKLAIRESPEKGIFVENVIVAPVTSSEQVLQLVSKGSAKRATAETRANEASSRSHAILTLYLTQVENSEELGAVIKTTSKVNIVDLAGSERAKATGAVGDRLKEGGSINQSLLVLGKVANALTNPESSTRHVPYRESKLTRILQDSLGGNAFTVMCCNVSPSTAHEQETLNALRFAERVKKITNKIRVNRDPLAQKMTMLLQENKQLRAHIQELKAYIEELEAINLTPRDQALRGEAATTRGDDDPTSPSPAVDPAPAPLPAEEAKQQRDEVMTAATTKTVTLIMPGDDIQAA